MFHGKKIINNKNISIHDKISSFNDSDYLYIPLASYMNKDFNLKVKEGDYVLKGDVLARSKDKYDFPIHSSVSGTVKEIKKSPYIDGTMVDAVVIENDFLEKEKKIAAKKKINTYTKEEVVNILKECGIVGMSGNNYPTYYKYGMELKIKKLIVNAVEAESYLTSDFTVMNMHSNEILETIDALMEIFKINECIIAVKEFNKKAIEDLIQYLGSYTKIKIKSVKDIYTMGWDKYLIKKLYNEKIAKNPMEKSIIVENVSTIYSIYEALKYRKPIVNRIVTFSGNKISNPTNVLVKIGCPIKDVIKTLGNYDKDNTDIIINGPMMGYKALNDSVMITKNTTGILFLDKNMDDVQKCINCGKCTNICPARLSPVLIMRNKRIETQKKLNPEKCIGCGMCSYICPSKINLRQIVKDAKNNCIKQVIK